MKKNYGGKIKFISKLTAIFLNAVILTSVISVCLHVFTMPVPVKAAGINFNDMRQKYLSPSTEMCSAENHKTLIFSFNEQYGQKLPQSLNCCADQSHYLNNGLIKSENQLKLFSLDLYQTFYQADVLRSSGLPTIALNNLSPPAQSVIQTAIKRE